MTDQHAHPSARLALATGVIGLIALACTCGPLQQIQRAESTVGAAQATIAPALTELKQNAPTFEAMASQAMQTAAPFMTQAAGTPGASSGGALTQYAVQASVSTQRSKSGDFSEQRMTGEPDVTECGDNPQAWASAGPTDKAELTLTYQTPVVPTQIIIYHSFNPMAVTEVDVVDTGGVSHQIFNGRPAAESTCPYQQVITPQGITYQVEAVRILLDQSVLGQQDEIDAVALIGTP